MHMLGVICEAVALILGSLVAALLLCLLLWQMFRWIGHPDWGLALLFLLLPLALAGWLPASDFARITTVFALLIAGACLAAVRGRRANPGRNGQ